MPDPKENETHSDFMERCIPTVLGEPDVKTNEHAIAKCNGIWEQNHPSSRKNTKSSNNFNSK